MRQSNVKKKGLVKKIVCNCKETARRCFAYSICPIWTNLVGAKFEEKVYCV